MKIVWQEIISQQGENKAQKERKIFRDSEG